MKLLEPITALSVVGLWSATTPLAAMWASVALVATVLIAILLLPSKPPIPGRS